MSTGNPTQAGAALTRDALVEIGRGEQTDTRGLTSIAILNDSHNLTYQRGRRDATKDLLAELDRRDAREKQRADVLVGLDSRESMAFALNKQWERINDLEAILRRFVREADQDADRWDAVETLRTLLSDAKTLLPR